MSNEKSIVSKDSSFDSVDSVSLIETENVLNNVSIDSNEKSNDSNNNSNELKEVLTNNETLSHDSLNDSNECMLSTFDNPFNPFEQFNNWFMFDIEKGYYSSAKLDRLTNITDDMSEKEYNEEVERAIDAFIKLDFTNTYTKVRRDTKTPVLSK